MIITDTEYKKGSVKDRSTFYKDFSENLFTKNETEINIPEDALRIPWVLRKLNHGERIVVDGLNVFAEKGGEFRLIGVIKISEAEEFMLLARRFDGNESEGKQIPVDIID